MKAYMGSPEWAGFARSTRNNRTLYLRVLEGIGHIKARDITRRHILTLRDAISKRGNGAAEGFLKAVSAMFAWAEDSHWVPFSPLHKIKHLKIGHLPEWKPEHANVALQGVPERLRRVIVLGLYTGQRRGDLCAIRWSDYDGTTLQVTQQKTGEALELRVHPDLKAELDSWERVGDTILLNARGRAWAPNSLSKLMPKALQGLGLPPGLNVHGMRKLFAASMADNGATPHEIGALTGHRTLNMIQLYTRSADQRKLSEGSVQKIQSFKNGPKEGEKP